MLRSYVRRPYHLASLSGVSVVTWSKRPPYHWFLASRYTDGIVRYLGRSNHHPRKVRECFGGSWIMGFLRKLDVTRREESQRGAPEDSDFERRYPALWEHVTATEMDGKPRQTSTLTMFVKDGRWVGILNDRSQEASLWADASTHEVCLEVLDELAQREDAPWRRNFNQASNRPRKK
jgi:hypothetical protein